MSTRNIKKLFLLESINNDKDHDKDHNKDDGETSSEEETVNAVDWGILNDIDSSSDSNSDVSSEDEDLNIQENSRNDNNNKGRRGKKGRTQKKGCFLRGKEHDGNDKSNEECERAGGPKQRLHFSNLL